MLRHPQYTRSILSSGRHRLLSSSVIRRCQSTTTDDEPAWFAQLRTEMLRRVPISLTEDITIKHELKLHRTLAGFLPDEWNCRASQQSPILPVGHHLVHFNPAYPTFELLADGTDVGHSPGDPWVRRMWAGGSISVRPQFYYRTRSGFAVNNTYAGAERITDVRLRGQDDSAKIFVTIERRFARRNVISERYKDSKGVLPEDWPAPLHNDFRQQLGSDGWGDAFCKEERNLVFLQKKSSEEIDATKSGVLAGIKYLDPPGTPDFSHTLTPTQSLLFRFSALTFNAHLIHLDREYARNVEGHRNLLVHGPLSLTLLLEAITGHVRTRSEREEVVEKIAYRNLAPLYCDEKMSLCGRRKQSTRSGSIYDVWIEGPTGGVAVKGTVSTYIKDLASRGIDLSKKAATEKQFIARRVVQAPDLIFRKIGTEGPSKNKVFGMNERLSDTIKPRSISSQKADATDGDSPQVASVRMHGPVSELLPRLMNSSDNIQTQESARRTTKARAGEVTTRTPFRSSALSTVDRLAGIRRVSSDAMQGPSPRIRSVSVLKIRRRSFELSDDEFRALRTSRFRKRGLKKVNKLRIRSVVKPVDPLQHNFRESNRDDVT